MNNLKQGDWVQYVNKIGQSEYGKYIKKIVKMHKLKTVLELEKIDGVHVYIDENTDCIRIPAEWAEKLEKLRNENIKEAQEMLVGINDVYETNDLQQRKRKEENTEDTVFETLIEIYKNRENLMFSTVHRNVSINNVKTNEYLITSGFYILNDDLTMTLIWRDGKMVE